MKRCRYILLLVLAVVIFCIPHAHASTIGISQFGPSTLYSGLVGWWAFDGKDTNWSTGITKDRSNSGNDGVLQNVATSSGVSQGKIGQALALTSINNQGALVNPSSSINDIDLQSAGNLSISLWLKPITITSNGFIISKGSTAASGYWYLKCLMGAGFNQMEFDKDYSSVVLTTRSAQNSITANAWNHIVVIWNGTATASAVSFYVNGVLQTHDVNVNGSGTKNADAANALLIGGIPNNPNLLGSLDDVRIYNRALSANEVTQLYTSTGGSKISMSPVGPAGLNSGLVGWWTFDGMNMVQNVADSSGNGNNGFMTGWTSTSSAVVPGKVGQALFYSGANTYVQIPNPSTVVAPYSVSVWFNLSKLSTALGTSQGLMYFSLSSPGRGVNINLNNQIEVDSYSAGTFRVACNKTFTAGDLNKWYHLVVVVNSTVDASQWKCYLNGVDTGVINVDSSGTYANPGTTNWTLGAFFNNSYWFNGKLDDVRIYNRALSANDVTQLYTSTGGSKISMSQLGPASLNSGLVGWWTMDGMDTNWTTGITNDKSGQGNNGQMIGMSTTSSVVTGKMGQALKFDGISSTIVVPNSSTDNFTSSNFSFSFWMKFNSANAGGDFLNKGDDVTVGYELFLANTGSLGFHTFQSGASQLTRTANLLFSTNTWTHVVFTRNGTVGTFYINGAPVSSYFNQDSIIDPASSASYTLNLFNGPNNYYAINGVLDDVRAYNRALSAKEVLMLYNMGK